MYLEHSYFHIYSKIISKLISEKKISTISYTKGEADDVIAVIKKNIKEKYPEEGITTITSV